MLHLRVLHIQGCYIQYRATHTYIQALRALVMYMLPLGCYIHRCYMH
jgi:hypothetical protein